MNKLIIIILLISSISCSIDRTIAEISKTEEQTLTEYQNIAAESKFVIADKNEPGERLLLCLTFINKEGKRVLPNQSIKFYHTSQDGEYEQTDPNDESSARLNGLATTNSNGQVYIETILPGDYGSSDDNRHIHTTVYGAKPEAYDINFKQYTGYMGKNFIKGSDQHFLADLKKTKDNILVSFLTIEAKRPNI